MSDVLRARLIAALIARANDGCEGEGNYYGPCYDEYPKQPRVWCDPCRSEQSARLLAALDPPAPPQEVWLVRQNDGGLRGVHMSQARAEDEIASICHDHPDLTRSDFIVHAARVRGLAALDPPAPQEPKP